jgi:hypothetical protein
MIGNTPPKPNYDKRVADLAFAILNEYRVRTNFVPEHHGQHFPAMVDDLATRIQDAINECIDEIDGFR